MEAVVLYDYAKDHQDDLCLRIGDVIVDVQVLQVEGGWYQGTLNGVRGTFHENFVKFRRASSQLLLEPPHPVVRVEAPSPLPETNNYYPPLHSQQDPGSTGTNEGDNTLHPSTAGGPQGRYARVLYTFSGDSLEELSLQPGQIVQVTGEDEEDWYSGVVNGKKGVFPATFVQLILDDPPSSESQAKPNGDLGIEDNARDASNPVVNASSHATPSRQEAVDLTPPVPEELVEVVKALYSYTATEPDELSVQAGDTLSVLQKDVQEGWWLVQRGGCCGLVPENFVKAFPPAGGSPPETAAESQTPPPPPPPQQSQTVVTSPTSPSQEGSVPLGTSPERAHDSGGHSVVPPVVQRPPTPPPHEGRAQSTASGDLLSRIRSNREALAQALEVASSCELVAESYCSQLAAVEAKYSSAVREIEGLRREVERLKSALSTSQPFERKGSLCGVEPIKETSMVVTNGAASFEWRGYGLKVHIPQNSLPPGVTEVKLKVIACLTGQFLLPDDSELVSAVYAVSSPCHFSSGLTLEIQHCAPMDGPLDNSSLTFVTAMSSPESALPYRFVPCKGGVFTREYQYGSIKTSHFSLFAIARYNDRTVHRPYGYSGHLFCAWNRPSRCSVYFTVTKELDASVSALSEHMQTSFAAKPTVQGFPVAFTEDHIALTVDKVEAGWKTTAVVPLSIKKQRVCGHFWRANIREMVAESSGSLTRLQCTLTHNGATFDNSINLILDYAQDIEQLQSQSSIEDEQLYS